MSASDYSRVARAIAFLAEHAAEQPGLEAVAAEVGLSPFHFQRLFQRWAGVSPKRFLQVLTLAEAKRRLAESRSLLDVSHAVGFSGPSRLHDLFLTLERMTPGEFKAQASGLRVRWGVAETPFGPALFAALDRGLCGLSFLGDGGREAALAELRDRWPGALLVEDGTQARGHAEALAARLRGEAGRPLSLVLKGTPLQFRTWEALLRVPPGQMIAYRDLAVLAGAEGALGQYHWGAVRKQAILAFERARTA
jgi:AraC family transcriptional regulator of adaptative response/methylated-DNA-[protein]-cysteine methyltransferase